MPTDQSASPTSRRRPDNARRGWTIAAVAALAAVTWSLAGLRLDRTPGEAAGAANLAALWPFWITSGLGWAALTGLAWTLVRGRGPTDHARSTGRPARRPTAIVLGVAVAARLVVLATHDPTLSDDVHRYVFDGRNVVAGVNPYLPTPSARAAAGPATDRPDERWPGEAVTAGRVNNPELPTIYLPVSQGVFALAAAATPDAALERGRGDRTMRAVFVAIEIVLLLLLAAAIRQRGRSPWWLALYAWHPLPLAEIAGSGHQDVIGITLLVAALVVDRAVPRRAGPWLWTPLVAGAALVKPVALPAAPILLRGRGWRAWLVSLGVGFVVCAVICGPVLLSHEGEPWQNLRGTAERFTLKWAHFGSVYEPTLTVIEAVTPDWGNDPQERLARKLCTGVLLVVAALVWWRVRDAAAACAAIFLAMVLLTPASHPWYLLWALALVPLTRAPGVWVASLTLPWGYAALGDTVGWTVPPWLMVVAYGPVYGAVLLGLRGREGSAAAEASHPTRA